MKFGFKFNPFTATFDYVVKRIFASDVEYTPSDATKWEVVPTNSQTAIDEIARKAEQEYFHTREYTGFYDYTDDKNSNIVVTYDSTTRKITLTGSFIAFYKGRVIPALVGGWASSAHAANPTTTLYLKYNGNGFEWSTTMWSFHETQIAYVCYKTTGEFCFAQREVHGLMQWQSHNEFHYVVGTVRNYGGDLSGHVVGSVVVSERRPSTSECVISDEDLTSVISSQSAVYNRFSLSGAAVGSFTLSSSDIVPTLADRPYYNSFDGTNWVQTPMLNNSYMSVWHIAIPTTADATSLQYRFVWIQGQWNSTTRQTIANETPGGLNLGGLSQITPEFVFINQVILKYSGGNWTIDGVVKITGSKNDQIQSAQGSFLSTVSSDDTINGSGTVSDPLTVSHITSAFCPCNETFLYDDFDKRSEFYRNGGWTSTTSNGGVVYSNNRVTNSANGTIDIESGTSSNGGAGTRLINTCLGAGVVTFESRIMIDTADVAGNHLYFNVGISDIGTYVPNNGVYFRYVGGVFYASTAYFSGGRQGTDTNTGVTLVGGTWYRLKFVLTDLASCSYYVNDVLVATVSTTMPLPATVIGPCIFARQGNTAITNRWLSVDYFWMKYKFNTVR